MIGPCNKSPKIPQNFAILYIWRSMVTLNNPACCHLFPAKCPQTLTQFSNSCSLKIAYPIHADVQGAISPLLLPHALSDSSLLILFHISFTPVSKSFLISGLKCHFLGLAKQPHSPPSFPLCVYVPLHSPLPSRTLHTVSNKWKHNELVVYEMIRRGRV